MFNLIAQYIGFGTDDLKDCNGHQDTQFGIAEEGDWTVVDVANIEDLTRNISEEEYQCVDTPENLNGLDWSMSETAESRVRDLPQTVAMSSAERRIRCPKPKKSQRASSRYVSRLRPNQMKRGNQVFCMRNSRVHQKMRQIVHQPRKY